MAKTQENTDNNAQKSTEKLQKENEQLRELLKRSFIGDAKPQRTPE